MPRKNYRKRIRRRPNKAPYFGKFGSDAKRALKLALYLKSMINAEKKFIVNDFTSPHIEPTTSGQIELLTAMEQGDTQSQRQGNSLKANSIALRYSTLMNPLATGSSIIRVIVLQEKVSNGAAPLVSDVLNTSIGSDVYASYNTDNMGSRFQIKYDKLIVLNEYRPTNSANVTIPLRHHIKFTGTTASQTDAANGHLYLLLMSSEATNEPSFIGQATFRYFDN